MVTIYETYKGTLTLFTSLENIADRVNKGTVDSEVLAKWIIQLVNVVYHFHSRGFFHRAIANARVMVTADDNILLGGFDVTIEAEQSD